MALAAFGMGRNNHQEQMVQCHESLEIFSHASSAWWARQQTSTAGVGANTFFTLFKNNDTELHQLIIEALIFPHVMGEFLPRFLPELAEGLLFAFLKKNGGIRPLLCGSIWRRCAARLMLMNMSLIVREKQLTRKAAHKKSSSQIFHHYVSQFYAVRRCP